MARTATALMLTSLLLCLTGCGWLLNPENGEKIEQAGATVKAVGQALPPPFGWLATLAGSGLGLYGAHLAGKRKADAFKAGGEGAAAALSPITKTLSDRKWLYPVLGAALAGAKGSGLLPIDGESMTQMLVMLGIPAAGEFLADAKAKSVAK